MTAEVICVDFRRREPSPAEVVDLVEAEWDRTAMTVLHQCYGPHPPAALCQEWWQFVQKQRRLTPSLTPRGAPWAYLWAVFVRRPGVAELMGPEGAA